VWNCGREALSHRGDRTRVCRILSRELLLWYKVTVMLALLKRPSAFLPLAISAGFLTAFLIMFVEGTLVRHPDEGTVAHLFQILMPAQLLIIVFFARSWLPKNPKPALQVLALQASAALGVLAVVYFRSL
jgi:hypothetical protein